MRSHDWKKTPLYQTVNAYSMGLLIMISSTNLPAQEEVSAFNLTGVDGYIAARYIFDDYRRSQGGSAETFQTRPTYEQEIKVMTHSYVYHPKLLDIDLGGGVLFAQQDFESNEGDSSSEDDLYNLSARLKFLKEKDYPLTLYYERSNPSVSTSQSGRFVAENTRYGLNASLREPLLPVTLTMDAFHFEAEGAGFDTTIDQVTDQASISAQKTYGNGNSLRLSVLTNDTISASGSPSLPIQQTDTSTQTTDLNAINYFGDDRRVQLTQLFTLTEQEVKQELNPLIDLENTRYNANLRWFHTDKMRSFYRYYYNNSDHSDVDTTRNAATIGASYEPEQGLSGNVDIHGENETQDSSGLERDQYGTLLAAGYKRDITHGSIQLGVSGLYDRSDQSSDQGSAQVVDENVTLITATPVVLQQDFIISGSIVVTNQARTLTYVEGLDYQLVTIGASTEIRLSVGSRIGDGDTVLVSYKYQTGGSFALDTFNHTVFLNLKLYRYYEFFTQYRNLSHSIKSGQPTVALNDTNNIRVGARVDYPFQSGWLVGGEVSHENHDEDISPFTRDKLTTYVESRLPYASKLRVTGRRERVENENSDEDVNLSQLIMRFTSKPWLYTRLLVEADYEKDNGGTLERRRDAQRIGLEWRFRRLLFSFRAENIEEKQGSAIQKQDLIRAQLVRTF